MSILEGDLAEIIADALESADIPYDLTVTRLVPGGGPPHDPGDPTLVEYPCLGFEDDYRADQRDGTIIQKNDRKAMIVAQSLSIVPVPGDLVTMRSVDYTIINVRSDPALALFECQVRL